MDTNKVLDGIDLVDRDFETLSAEKLETEQEIAGLAAKETALRARLAELTAQHEVAVLRPSVMERALAAIAAMENAGMGEAAARAAIVAQYGKVVVAPPKALKPPSAHSERRISTNLPSEDIQKAILATVKERGAAGIRMEELHDKFDALNVEHLAVFGTVKNAVLDGNIRRDGVTRGLKYYWLDKPVAAPAVETAPVVEASAEAPAAENTEPTAQ